MRREWLLTLATLSCTAVMAGCGGTDGANDDRPAQTASATEAQNAVVEVIGCVTGGPGASRLVLRNVEMSDKQSSAQMRASSIPGLTEHSYVKLTSDSGTDLMTYVGQKVAVRGTVMDSGADTIGTSGTSGEETPSTDKSHAATDTHHSEKVRREAGGIGQQTIANGDAASIRVQSVNPTGERCTRPE